nr:CMF_HP1_G0042460.mRNA.1.CDS.1 [Saccharomyces cerevisiae]
MRDIKHIKRFKLGYTQSTETTLPGYDFTFWENGMEIYDKSKYETKTSSIQFETVLRKKSGCFHCYCSEIWGVAILICLRNTQYYLKRNSRGYTFICYRSTFIDFEIDTGLGLPCSMRSPGGKQLVQ